MAAANTSTQPPPLPRNAGLVSLEIKINGNLIPPSVMVSGVRVMRAANRVPYAVITILDGEAARQTFEVSDQDLFSPGNAVEVLAGYNGRTNAVFKGIVIRHGIRIKEGGGGYLEIECKHECVKLTMDRRNKYFYQQTDSDIISEILRGRGLSDEVDTTSVNHAEMVQYSATDWDFIVSRAEANGMLVISLDGKVAVKKPNFSQSPKFTLDYGASIIELEAEMDARDQYPPATVSSWDVSSQALLSSQPGSTPGGAPAASTPNTDFTQTLGLSAYPLQHPGYLKAPEAQQWAEAQMAKSQLARLQGRVKFEGVADVYPGDTLSLSGVGLRHNGAVFITAVAHEIANGGWYTHAQFGLPRRWFAQEFDDVSDAAASALVPAVHGLQSGVVTALATDPDGLYRVQVRLPMVSAQGEGAWVRVAAQDAGNNRGAFWLPEIGDEVVVGFFNDDPRQAVMLGMLHNGTKAAPLTAADANPQKGWTTRSGIKWIFDDDKKSVLLQTPAGKKITVDDSGDQIHLEDEHGNKITMSAAGIVIDSAKDLTLKAAQNVTVEGGANVKVKAGANLEATGSAMAKLESSGNAVVKGATVMIN